MKKSIEDLLDDSSILNKENLENINEVLLSSLINASSNEYFEILNAYIKAKKIHNLTTQKVAERSELPELTVKRIENLKTIPKALTLIKLLKSVNLRLGVFPIDDVVN